MIKAPWNPTQVKNLTDRQQCKHLHPYTCGHCSENDETTELLPCGDGWYCPRCDCMVQDWAHTHDVTGKFKDLVSFRQKLDSEIDALLAEV